MKKDTEKQWLNVSLKTEITTRQAREDIKTRIAALEGVAMAALIAPNRDPAERDGRLLAVLLDGSRDLGYVKNQIANMEGIELVVPQKQTVQISVGLKTDLDAPAQDTVVNRIKSIKGVFNVEALDKDADTPRSRSIYFATVTQGEADRIAAQISRIDGVRYAEPPRPRHPS